MSKQSHTQGLNMSKIGGKNHAAKALAAAIIAGRSVGTIRWDMSKDKDKTVKTKTDGVNIWIDDLHKQD